MATDKVTESARRSGSGSDDKLERLLSQLADTPAAIPWVADAVEFLARTRNRQR